MTTYATAREEALGLTPEMECDRFAPPPRTPAVNQCEKCGRVIPLSVPRCYTCEPPLESGAVGIFRGGRYMSREEAEDWADDYD